MKKTKTIILLLCFMALSLFSLYSEVNLYPIFDAPNDHLPRNLRTTQQIVKSSVDMKGLYHLNASGSGQFSESTFQAMIRHLSIKPHQLVIFDLRQESHGFVNGIPISWTDGLYNYANRNKNLYEIEQDEYQRLKLAVQSKQMIINPLKNPVSLNVHQIKTERNLVESYGSSYIRLPVTDHNRPTNEVVDQFVELVKTIPSDYWIHFHCKAGKGRTTTFLVLVDIMRNCQSVSLQDILLRQKLIGGLHLGTIDENKAAERVRAAHERLEFITQFYAYCRQVPNFQISWSDWVKQQSVTVANP